MPGLLLRKAMNMECSNGKAGFDARGNTMNALLYFLARCESLPQKLLGTSVMAVLENYS